MLPALALILFVLVLGVTAFVVFVERGQRRLGSRLPVAGNRAVDEILFDSLERVVVETQPLHHAGFEVLNDYIGTLYQLVHDLCGIG